ncbi:MAG: SpoIIE family protein phosphatase [Leptospiraceae bacterium]|nr:SpoIIE family protein phosphatase [Leptospiraceae bacterium]
MELELQTQTNIFPDFKGDKRPIFSAYECGKLAVTLPVLEQENKFFLVNQYLRFQTLHEEYMANEELDFLPVFDTDSNEIIGYTMRQKILAALSKGPFSKELLLRPEVTVQSVYDKRVLCIDAYTNLSETSYLLMQRDEDIRFDPFIITMDGYFYGICSIQKIIDGLNRFLEKDMSFCEVSQLKLMLETNKNFKQESNMSVDYRVNCLHGPGGDYVGTFSLSPNLSLFVHLDVCGKGLKASTVVMVIGTILKTWVEMEKQEDLTHFKLSERLSHLNRLSYNLTPDEMYATGVFVLYYKVNQTIEVFDYGHGFIWLKRKNKAARLSEFMEESQSDKMDKMPFFAINEDLQLESKKFKVKPGDFIFICTDGIAEQKNMYKEEFGTNNIKKVLKEFDGKNPAELNDLILEEWEDFRKHYKIMDDYSILSIAI